MSVERNNSGIESRVEPVEISFKAKPKEISFKHNEETTTNKELIKSNTLPKKVLSPKIESIEVDEEKLKKINPNIDKKVLKSAKNIVNNLPVSKKVDEVFLFWGAKQLEEYSKVTQNLLNLTKNSSIHEVSKVKGEIAEKLSELNKICFEKGILNFIFSSSKKERFDDFYLEVEKITLEIKNKLPEVLELNKKLKEIESELFELSDVIQSHIIAGEFILYYLEYHSETHLLELLGKNKEILRERVISLNLSFIEVKSTGNTVSLIKEQTLRIISAVNETIGIDIPKWYSLVVNNILTETEKLNDNSEIENLFENIIKTLTNK